MYSQSNDWFGNVCMFSCFELCTEVNRCWTYPQINVPLTPRLTHVCPVRPKCTQAENISRFDTKTLAHTWTLTQTKLHNKQNQTQNKKKKKHTQAIRKEQEIVEKLTPQTNIQFKLMHKTNVLVYFIHFVSASTISGNVSRFYNSLFSNKPSTEYSKHIYAIIWHSRLKYDG